MSKSPQLLCAALVLGGALTAPPARADTAPPEDAPIQEEAPPDMRKVKAARHSVWMAYIGVHDPARRRVRRALPPPSHAEESHPLQIRLGVETGVKGEGSLLGFRFGLDGQRWGMAERVELVSAVAANGSGGQQRVQLLSAHLTFSPLVGERGRLRLEAGAAAAHEAGATYFGPSVGLSFERCLFGALDVEGRGQWVPMPQLQLEAQLGLGLHIGGLTLHGGWRALYLDDHGLVNGDKHVDRGSGPYAGVGLHF